MDDLEPQGPAPKKSKKEKVDKPEKPEKPEKVAKPEKVSKKSKEKKALAPTTVPEVKRPPKETNITALQVETQQTLKDINKWLNDTPYASAGNSPSRYNLDDFDAVAVTIDEADFRKPMIPPLLASPNTSAATGDNNPLKESNNNKLVPGGAPSSSHQKKDPKDPKRKTLKQIIQPRKKDHQQRTIDRLQPGKTKGKIIYIVARLIIESKLFLGNLLSNIQNINKPEELFPLGAANKVKEVKNSLIVKTDESGPKLSLGTVLDTEDFGLIQQHNFNEDSGDKTAEKNVEEDEEDPKTEEIKDKDEKKVDKEVDSEKAADKDLLLTPSESKPVGFKNDVKKDEKEVEGSGKGADSKKEAPNFNAWFKAFGAPKKPKKTDEEESKDLKEGTSPRQRQRKASTGSTVSERSSYSQDPDSPRIAIDERLGGAYPAPYPSPIGASPVMASPKTEDLQKAAYPLNGAIKVGFYQDMTSTKSSPEKSSSPREMPSPYPQYSQHLYSTPQSATSPSIYNTYNTSYNPPTDAIPSKAVTYSKSTASPASYYDQYKQPMSQESDFNNSMSPSTNPNSPYHSQQSSPYQQQPNSPFQQGNQFQTPNQAPSTPGTQGPNSPYSQPNSPYQQPQASPYHMQQSQQNTQQKHQGPNSPFSNPSSPYSQHDPNSPYGSGQLSPYGQTVSPKATPNNSINTNNAINPINQVNTANQTKTAAPEWPATNLQSKVPPSVPVNYQPPQQPAHFNVPPQTQQQSQQHQMGPSASPQSQQNIAQSLQLGYQNPPANFSLPNYDAKKKTDEQQANIFEATMKNQQRSNMPEMINLGYSGTDSSGNKPAENKTAANIAANIALNAAKQQEQSNKFLDLTKQQHQQQMYNIMNYNKPLDFGKPQEISKTKAMDMFNRAATLNFPKNPFPPTAGVNSPASCSKPNEYSGPNPNLYGALSSSGNPGNVPTNPGITSAANTAHVTKPGMESTPDYSLVQKNMAYAKPVEQPKQPNSFPTGNMTQHQNKMQATPQPEVPKNPPATATELNIPNMPNMNMQRFDPIRHSANMANMDMNYKNPPFNASPASMMNLASFMRDFQTEDPRSLLGLTGQAPSSYYDTKNIPPAHMFGKNLQHSNAPNSIQQMLMSNTMNSMSSMAQYSSREQHNLNMNFQNRMQQAPAVVPPSAAAPPAVEKPKRSRKKKNATPDVPAQVQQQPSAQNMTNQHQMQQQQLAHQQQGFQSYAGIKTTGPQPTSAEASAISLKTASVVPGSAFNFGPGPAGLGLYENSSYLEDYRGTSNPYYAPPLGHRSTPDPSSIETQKNPPPAHPPQASSPYHQYLTHQSRPSYPFMNHHPSLDIHQWQQQSQELSRQMMMNQGLLGNSGSSTTYPSGYHPAMGMHTRPHWM